MSLQNTQNMKMETTVSPNSIEWSDMRHSIGIVVIRAQQHKQKGRNARHGK